jgi:serine/threonine-protein kinase PpkA
MLGMASQSGRGGHSAAARHHPQVLVVDDDPVIREYVRLHLVTADFEVVSVPDVSAAMAAIARHTPDIIVSDISMPHQDGFEFLSRLRANPNTQTIPFIFLTQHTTVEDMRRGMQLGANDFLTKPIRRQELINAVSGRLKILEGLRRTATTEAVPTVGMPVVNRVISEAESARARGEAFGSTPVHAPELQVHAAAAGVETGAQRTVDGSVLFSDIRNFSSIAEKLTAAEVAELLNAFFASACEPVLAQRGWVVKFVGDGLIAMFDGDVAGVTHQGRALKAALLMTTAAHQFQRWIDRHYGDRSLPRFAIGVGVHSGDVSVAKMGARGTEETTILGDVVNVAARLESSTKELGWSIAASAETVLFAGDRITVNRSGQVGVKGRESMVDLFEVVGLLPREDESENNEFFYTRIQEAVLQNTAVIASNLAARPDVRDISSSGMVTTGRVPIRLDGYRLLRKLGEGGMSQVFLSEHIASGQQQVLKIIKLSLDENAPVEENEIVQRFISEYALISQIDHPNVAKIYHQGFGESHAYISMEYFPGGDLRQLMSGAIGETIAVATLIQVAGALAAIHERGIVHRDMKPDNVMIRADGSMALADFGIAMQIDTQLDRTDSGEIYGTPSYISPEQASDEPVDHRADIYALGIMFYELLVGKKPFRAPSVQSLLTQHIHAEIPALPDDYRHYQGLVNKMLAKKPVERFQSADEIIDVALSISPPNL